MLIPDLWPFALFTLTLIYLSYKMLWTKFVLYSLSIFGLESNTLHTFLEKRYFVEKIKRSQYLEYLHGGEYTVLCIRSS